MEKQRRIPLAFVFVAGAVVGIAGMKTYDWFASSARSKGRVEYRLTEDLDLGATYLLRTADPSGGAPEGLIRAGTVFEVEWSYSQARYLVFRTVISAEQLTRVARPLEKNPPSSSVHEPGRGTGRPGS